MYGISVKWRYTLYQESEWCVWFNWIVNFQFETSHAVRMHCRWIDFKTHMHNPSITAHFQLFNKTHSHIIYSPCFSIYRFAQHVQSPQAHSLTHTHTHTHGHTCKPHFTETVFIAFEPRGKTERSNNWNIY